MGSNIVEIPRKTSRLVAFSVQREERLCCCSSSVSSSRFKRKAKTLGVFVESAIPLAAAFVSSDASLKPPRLKMKRSEAVVVVLLCLCFAVASRTQVFHVDVTEYVSSYPGQELFKMQMQHRVENDWRWLGTKRNN